MSKPIKHNFKRNIIILSIIVTSLFLLINIALYIINSNYLSSKIKEENEAFLELTTHLLNENDESDVLEYVLHYTHIHEVEIEILNDENLMIFSTNIAHRYARQYQIDTVQGSYTVFIDNTGSTTVQTFEQSSIYINVALLIIYIISMTILVLLNKKSSNRIDRDLEKVITLIQLEKEEATTFEYFEFDHIYHVITNYLKNIDMLRAQKEMYMKGLAHDIKTPLTLIYHYFNQISNKETVLEVDRENAYNAAQEINLLVNQLLSEDQQKNFIKIDLSSIVNSKVDEYKNVFETKKIDLVKKIENNLKYVWNNKDISRILDNLLSNAYYYSKKDSQVVIELKKNEKIILSVISTPKDLKPLRLDSLFDKGTRGTNSINENQYGKGYGLYICTLLLAPIDGTIKAEIINENVKFTIQL
jgi:signal transduction histidine kinase